MKFVYRINLCKQIRFAYKLLQGFQRILCVIWALANLKNFFTAVPVRFDEGEAALTTRQGVKIRQHSAYFWVQKCIQFADLHESLFSIHIEFFSLFNKFVRNIIVGAPSPNISHFIDVTNMIYYVRILLFVDWASKAKFLSTNYVPVLYNICVAYLNIYHSCYRISELILLLL